jgi:hypothetical protein
MTKKLPPDELAERRKTHKKPGVKRGRLVGSTQGPISGAKAIELTKKQADALGLRLAGASLMQIAESVGWETPAAAHSAIMSALKTILPPETRDEYRRLEIARLDRLEQGHWVRALNGDDKSANVVLKCIGMRAKLLGLEAPAQVQVSLFEGEVVEVGVLDLLDEQQLAKALELRDSMAELSRMRAGAIEAEPS